MFWSQCPQLRDDEPKKSGRHCPLDKGWGDDPYWKNYWHDNPTPWYYFEQLHEWLIHGFFKCRSPGHDWLLKQKWYRTWGNLINKHKQDQKRSVFLEKLSRDIEKSIDDEILRKLTEEVK